MTTSRAFRVSMRQIRWAEIVRSEVAVLVLLAVLRLLLHALTNNTYGFHRDELAILDDARYLAWGYVAYPPLTPFVGRLAMTLLGATPAGVRFFSGLAQAVALLITGLMARELGGKRWAVIMAGAAVWIAPVSFAQGALFQYVSFDYLWWVTAAYCMIRLLKSEQPRWWLAIGCIIGLGMQTKYTMAFFAAGIAGGVILTPARKYLRSRWLWGGVGLALLIFLPNLIWQVLHNWVSLQQLSAIHAHDVQIGRADHFLLDQVLLGANPLTLPVWTAGLFFYFFAREGRPYRALGWMYLLPLVAFAAAQGRGYYTAPAYPMLLAAGTVVFERWMARLGRRSGVLARSAAIAMLCAGTALVLFLALPAAPVNSAWWNVASAANTDWKEEIGWQELAGTVQQIWNTLPAEERASTGIFTNNYGEAGAINMYGPALGLPRALSAVNSYWLRGYGNPAPRTLVVVGYERAAIEPYFEGCELAGRITNRYGVQNEESKTPEIFICRNLLISWDDFWEQIHHFG